jgi:hypothetical protein
MSVTCASLKPSVRRGATPQGKSPNPPLRGPGLHPWRRQAG